MKVVILFDLFFPSFVVILGIREISLSNPLTGNIQILMGLIGIYVILKIEENEK